jgi:2-keto-3-deoxy-6-phosphogluconate aldolase
MGEGMANELQSDFRQKLESAPFIAILRGVQHREVVEIAEALVSTGISIIEITVDSPDPYVTMETLALRTVLPEDTIYLPTGGLKAHKVQSWMAAGAVGFGLGTSIYTPGTTADEVLDRARVFTQILVRHDA